MRNNNKDLPSRISLDKERNDIGAFASKRPDGSINDRPGERMKASRDEHDTDNEAH